MGQLLSKQDAVAVAGRDEGGSARASRRWPPAPALPPVVVVLFAVDLLMGVAAAVAYLFTASAGTDNLWFVRLGQENNLPTWYSSSQLLLVSLLLGALALREWRRFGGRAWPVIAAAALFAFLSLDEAASIHEWVGHTAQRLLRTDGGLRTGIWFVVCLPPFLLALMLLARGMWPYLRGRAWVVRLYLLGFLALVFSAVALEAISNLWHGDTFFVRAETLFEEVGEMVAATLMLWATLLLLEAEGVRLVLEDAQADR